MNKINPLELIKGVTSNKSMIFIDQSLFAFFNFCIIFVLSKVAEIQVFSSFVLFQSNIFFLYILCTFFLSSPILVLHSKRWKQHDNYYLKTLFIANFLINAILSVAIYFFLKFQEIYIELYYIFLIPVLMTSLDILKKHMLSSLKIKMIHAAIATLILNLVFFVSLFFNQDNLNLSIILRLYFIAYLSSVLYLLAVFGFSNIIIFKSQIFNHNTENIFLPILKHHFTYSKWIILGGIAFWGYNQGIFIFSKILGVNDLGIGKIRTVQNLLGVVNIFMVSVENFYTPLFSKYIVSSPNQKLHSLVKNIYSKLFYKLIILIFIVFIFALVFYDLVYYEKYGSGWKIIILFTITHFLIFAIRPMIIALKSIELTYPLFSAHTWAAIIMVVAGYFLITKFEYYGMAYVFALSNLIFSSVILLYYGRKIIKHKND